MKSIVLAGILAFCICACYAQNCPSSGGGPNFSGKDLTNYNFTTYPQNYLIGANFSNAILDGAQFQNVNLTNANFSNAKMRVSSKGRTDLSGANLDHACFQMADMDSAILQFAIFRATDFSNASLMYADFGPMMTVAPSTTDNLRTKFNHSTLDFDHFPISSWPASYWAYTDLSYTTISGITNNNFNFKNKDISQAILTGQNFTNFDFTAATMSGVWLNESTLSYATLSRCKLDQSNLTGAQMNMVKMDHASFYNPQNVGKSANLSGVTLNNATITSCDFSYANFQGASLLGATADSSKFNYANFQSGNNYDVASLSGASLSYSSFSSAGLNGVNLTNSYIINGQFNDLTLLGTNFTNANMPGANFKNSKLEGVLFTGAILQNVNFTNTTMKTPPNGGSGVDFTCTQLGGSNFSNATVLQANFADAVMPVADSCCKTVDGYYCGIIAINQLGYGAVTLPVLNNKVTCPNGAIAQCTGTQWVVPHWRSSSCNPGHTSQLLWYKPNCSGKDTTGQIHFPDPNLEASLMKQMSGGDPNYIITKHAAAQVPSLNCSYSKISNLEGLQYFTALEELDVSGNFLTDGTFFTRIPSLNSLSVANNLITLLNLQGLSNLNYLNASSNQINSLLLDAGAYISFLNVSYNALSQLDITIQTWLEYLDVSHNKLTNIGSVEQLANLNSLFIQNNSLTTVGSVKKLYNSGSGNLIYMNISCNLPFKCNTLQLDSTPQEKNFLTHSLCGVNNLPGCGSKQMERKK
ncbi:MAG: pentapeptide repeat-containing protein [Saprospiraceae bacterium]